MIINSVRKRENWVVYRHLPRDFPQLIEYDENYKPLPFDWPTPPPNSISSPHTFNNLLPIY